MPYTQTLPLVLLQKELLISKLLSRLQLKARLSLEPIFRYAYIFYVNLYFGHLGMLNCVILTGQRSFLFSDNRFSMSLTVGCSSNYYNFYGVQLTMDSVEASGF